MATMTRGKKIRSIRAALLDSQVIDLDLFSGIKQIDKQKIRYHTLPGKATKRRNRESEYALLMNMKQAMKHYYGVRERQFYNAYLKSANMKGSTGENLLQLLESRLDNVIFRAGLAVTRAQARQMVVHRQVTVDGRVVDRPSFSVSVGQVVGLVESASKHQRVVDSLAIYQESDRTLVSWLENQGKDCQYMVKEKPSVDVLVGFFKVNMVVELYSK